MTQRLTNGNSEAEQRLLHAGAPSCQEVSGPTPAAALSPAKPANRRSLPQQSGRQGWTASPLPWIPATAGPITAQPNKAGLLWALQINKELDKRRLLY